MLGFKTPEKLAHLLTSEHSPLNDLSTPDQPVSADEIQPQQPTSKPTTSSPAVSALSGGKDSDQSYEQLVDGWNPPSKQPRLNSSRISKVCCVEQNGHSVVLIVGHYCEWRIFVLFSQTPKHSQSTALYNPDESALAMIQRKTSTPATPSTPSPAANTSEDRNEVSTCVSGDQSRLTQW